MLARRGQGRQTRGQGHRPRLAAESPPTVQTKGDAPMTTLTAAPDIESLKSGLRTTWMAGDYDRFSRFMEGGARDFYERLDLAPGSRLLDVACGGGQLSLMAARD